VWPFVPAAYRLLVPALILAVALSARLAGWGDVFRDGRTHLSGDSDPHYHVLRAERWLAGAPGAPWRDPGFDWPRGADVPWPPLFDGIVATAGRLRAGAAPDREAIAAAAAPVPVALGLALVLLVAALGRRLGSGGWTAAFLVAILPASSELSSLGRIDQHVLEVVLFAAMLLALAPSARAAGAGPPDGRRRGAVLAVLATLAFWSWMGSALHLLVVACVALAWHLLDDDAAGAGLAALAIGGLAGGALLGVSVAALGPPGALSSGRISGVGGLHVALLAASGAFALILWILRRRRSGPASLARRCAEAAVAAALPAAPLLLAPTLRAGIAGGLVAVGAASPWFATIDEFRPIFGSGVASLADDALALLRGYGLVHAAAAAGALVLAQRWRRDPSERRRIAFLLVAAGLLVPLAFARKRFGVYAVVPLALLAEVGLVRAAAWLASRAAAAFPRLAASPAPLAALALAITAPALPEHLAPSWTLPAEQEECLRFAGSWPAARGAEGVLAPWAFGHLVQYFARRPVVASPFGTEAGEHALEDTAAFWFAPSQSAAEDVLLRRRAGLVLLAQVITEAVDLHPFAPPATPAAMATRADPLHGTTTHETDAFWRMIPNRLYYEAGLPSGADPALDAFRLLWETPSSSPQNPAEEQRWMLYERVPGARVHVSGARGRVRASVRMRTNAGRELVWWSEAAPDADAVARLRLPYASGWNGGTRVSEWTVSDGAASTRLVLHAPDVERGRLQRVELRASAPRAARR
jgi:asparagine N-glycosylation enzyme membrane subunit Stt3